MYVCIVLSSIRDVSLNVFSKIPFPASRHTRTALKKNTASNPSDNAETERDPLQDDNSEKIHEPSGGGGNTRVWTTLGSRVFDYFMRFSLSPTMYPLTKFNPSLTAHGHPHGYMGHTSRARPLNKSVSKLN